MQEKKKAEFNLEDSEVKFKKKLSLLREENLDLKKQVEKLMERDKKKSSLYLSISNEFRNPLTLIISPLEQMLSVSKCNDEKKKLASMLHNSHRLLELINQLLELSKFETGQLKLATTKQDIVMFLHVILENFYIVAQYNKLDLEFHNNNKEIFLFFDGQKMEEVIINLIINCIKFTSSPGKIEVSVLEAGQKENGEIKIDSSGYVEIRFQNSGPCISDAQLLHIFDLFSRAEYLQTADEDYVGKAIGMSLTRDLIELHHGTLDVKNELGKGTIFIIRLPKGKEHLSPEEIIDNPVSVEPRKSDQFPVYFPMGLSESEPEQVCISDMKNIKKMDEKITALIVDDNSIIRKYVHRQLAPSFNVIEAVDGQDGVNIAREKMPDIIISDIVMPGMDGFELCHSLKTDIKTCHIPIVLLTSQASSESISRGKNVGADDYIIKPFNSNELLLRLNSVLLKRKESELDKEFLKETREFIEQNLLKPELNLTLMVQRFKMNPIVLSRKLFALTGEPLEKYIRSFRLDRAVELLKNTDRNISDIAFSVGFINTGEFAGYFKEKFNQLPTAFKHSLDSKLELPKDKVK